MVEEWKRRTEIAQEVVLRLDQAQERRPLTPGELSLRKRAKQRILGFAALRRIKIRQRSRLTWIREGDANSGGARNWKLGIPKKKKIIS